MELVTAGETRLQTKVVAVCRFAAFFLPFLPLPLILRKKGKKRLIHYYLLLIELLNKINLLQWLIQY
jgi:hypothetical protein